MQPVNSSTGIHTHRARSSSEIRDAIASDAAMRNTQAIVSRLRETATETIIASTPATLMRGSTRCSTPVWDRAESSASVAKFETLDRLPIVRSMKPVMRVTLRRKSRLRRGRPARSAPCRPSPKEVAELGALQKRRRVAGHRRGPDRRQSLQSQREPARAAPVRWTQIAICCRACGVEKSSGAHSPQAAPAARMPSGVRISSTASAIHKGRSALPSDGFAADAGARRSVFQQRRLGALQIRDHSRGDDHFRQAGDGQVADHHRGNGDVQRIRRVERRAGRIVKEHRLNAELDRGQQTPTR